MRQTVTFRATLEVTIDIDTPKPMSRKALEHWKNYGKPELSSYAHPVQSSDWHVTKATRPVAKPFTEG